MEEGQDTSQFKIKKKQFFYGEQFPEAIFRRQNNFLKRGTPDISRLLRTLVTAFYQALDRLIGSKSQIIVPKERNFLLDSYQEVFQLLKLKGIVKSISSLGNRFNDAPHFFRFDILSSYPESITDGHTSSNPSGYGFSKDEEIAVSKSIGEFLERFFLTIYKKNKLIRGSIDLLKNRKHIVDLDTFAGFSEVQRENDQRLRHDTNSVFYWEKITKFSNKSDFYIPAQYVYWNYEKEKDEPVLVETNTNGAGGFFSKEGAILSGLYELIQRDSFLIYWLNTLAPMKINPESVPDDAFQNILKESRRYGFEIHCLNITSDIGVPSFAVVIEDTSGIGPRFSLGAGCQPNPAKALLRALEEAWAVYYWIRPLPPFALPENYEPFSDHSIGQQVRLRLWSNKEMAGKFSFFLSGKEKEFSDVVFTYPQTFASELDELNHAVSQVESLGPGYEVYYYMHRDPILSKLGFYVARVIVPQLVPLYLNETRVPLGARRLREVPSKLGYQAAAEPNPLPHPFP